MTDRSKFKILGVVENDPDIDYEYFDTHDFGDEMEEADGNGELFRGFDFLAYGSIWEAFRKMDEITAAKKALRLQGSGPEHPYPFPHRMIPVPAGELCLAEDPGAAVSGK